MKNVIKMSIATVGLMFGLNGVLHAQEQIELQCTIVDIADVPHLDCYSPDSGVVLPCHAIIPTDLDNQMDRYIYDMDNPTEGGCNNGGG